MDTLWWIAGGGKYVIMFRVGLSGTIDAVTQQRIRDKTKGLYRPLNDR